MGASPPLPHRVGTSTEPVEAARRRVEQRALLLQAVVRRPLAEGLVHDVKRDAVQPVDGIVGSKHAALYSEEGNHLAHEATNRRCRLSFYF